MFVEFEEAVSLGGGSFLIFNEEVGKREAGTFWMDRLLDGGIRTAHWQK